MDRRVTPPKPVTSPAWGPPPPCKQAFSIIFTVDFANNVSVYLNEYKSWLFLV